MAEVKERKQTYLWDGRIARGTPTLLVGRQGATKNLLVYDWISRVTTGSPWPGEGQAFHRQPAAVVFLEAEEHLETCVKPRLVAAEADCSRVLAIQGTCQAGEPRTQFVSLQRDIGLIDGLLTQRGDVVLVVISPVTSYLGSVEQNTNEQVRNEIIHPLKALAEKHECAVVILKHPNKVHTNTDPIERVGGSAAWTETMRTVIVVGEDPDQPADCRNPRRAAFWEKFSLGPQPDPISWKLTVADNGAPRIEYLREPVHFTASDMLMRRRRTLDTPSKQDRAEEFIKDFLANGPRLADELKRAAESEIASQAQFSLDAFERARREAVKAGWLCRERRPEIPQTEWWVWLDGSAPPEWFRSGNHAEAGP
jgi:hypothetical protein